MRKVFYGVSLIVALATLVVVGAGSSNKVATNMGPDPMGIQALNSTSV